MNLQFRFGLGCVLIVVAVYFCADVFAQKETGDNSTLADRVNALEKEVAKLHREVQDLHLSDKLTGHWGERTWMRNGEYVDQSEAALGIGFGGPVEWRLASDVNSQRWLLCAEPETTNFGRFTVDTSKTPAWIDFQLAMNGRTVTIRGIVEHSYGKARIAIPTDLFDGDKFKNPARPTSFDSTAKNGYSVYSFQRPTFDRTGVF
ncbi:hypothetical protein [Aporhodopirellula aestuarii]|uniref:Uncharacterized protein n=1 Tax=Aporhodopirellula aestuarii TaxID=2950107 RepID=A0ABT0U8X9_9BACT|nr:hypothetical protein [Aporhodopirellula aestuarii]MCM2373423.1 hypothetical protein [Aporhodopirellula aestuarii]